MAFIRIYDLSKPHSCLPNYKMFAGYMGAVFTFDFFYRTKMIL